MRGGGGEAPAIFLTMPYQPSYLIRPYPPYLEAAANAKRRVQVCCIVVNVLSLLTVSQDLHSLSFVDLLNPRR